MGAPIIKTDVSFLSKVKSIGATFFREAPTVDQINATITNMNNVGIVDFVICATGDTTTDFGMLEVGDYAIALEAGHGNAAGFEGPVVTAGTLTTAGQIGTMYIVLRPSK
tara:strand:- start:20120 stop:20449 length:330 start_codon:yes stop_codon:yes gene_type:complete